MVYEVPTLESRRPLERCGLLKMCGDLVDLNCTLVKMSLCFGWSTFRCLIPPEERPVVNDIVLVTGSAHGIGKEVATQYALLGAQVICVDINESANQNSVAQMKLRGLKVTEYTCDVSNREAVLDLAKKVREDIGFVTILVNNVGIMPCKRFMDHTPSEIERLFSINVMSQFWTLEAFLPPMIENDYGHIVALSSVAGLGGFANVTPYSATKHAITGLMEGLMAEMREDGRNISCTTVYPFMVDTGLCKKPKIGFPLLLKMQKPENVAARIISAQRRGFREVSAPFFMETCIILEKLLPDSVKHLIFDFLKTGLDACE